MHGGYAADDFVVSAGQTWEVAQIFVLGSYVPDAGPAPDFDVVVYNSNGGAPDTVVISHTAVSPVSDVNGDITLAMNPPIVLGAGTYWLSVNANMDFGDPPEQWFWTVRTVQTGEPYHWMETGVFGTSCTSGWQPGASVCGVGGGADPDLAFGMRGSHPDVGCDSLSDLPWVTANPVSGTVAVSSTLPVDVGFDSTGYVPGVYTGTLCIASNDPVQPLFPIPLTMTVVTPTFGVAVEPDDSDANLPGMQVNYSLSVTNIGNVADVYTVTVSSTWAAVLSYGYGGFGGWCFSFCCGDGDGSR